MMSIAQNYPDQPGVLNHLEFDGESGVLWDPPIFHFVAAHPSIEEGFCLLGTWALADDQIGVVSIALVPSCEVVTPNGERRRREPEEIPFRHGVLGVDTEAIEQIRLFDLREAIYRTMRELRSRAQIDVESIRTPALRALLSDVISSPLAEPRRRGRPENVDRKRRRAEQVIDAYAVSVEGAREELRQLWDLNSVSSVSSQIQRLLEEEWLIRSDDRRRRYVAGPRLIAEQEGD